MPDWTEPPTVSDAPFQVGESLWTLLCKGMTQQHLGELPYNNDHAVHEEGGFGGSVPSGDAIGANPEHAQSFETLDPGYHEATGDVSVDPEPKKGPRKRDRDRNWTDEETSVLVECKALAFHDKASSFRKQNSGATDWEAISKELRSNPDTRASEKTGNQCRLRWDTLVKSHRIIKERCIQAGLDYAELSEEEISGLKLATTLRKEWYEVVDAISRKSRSQKRDHPPGGAGNFPNHEGGTGTGADPMSPRIPPPHQGPLSSGAEISPPCSPPLHLSSSRPEPCNSSPKQIGVRQAKLEFSKLSGHLRSTLLDIILVNESVWMSTDDDIAVSYCCRWLSVVQNRSFSDIYDDVSVLVKMGLVLFSEDGILRSLGASFLRKVIRTNLSCDTHRDFGPSNDTKFISARDFSAPERIRVLSVDSCNGLERINFRGLRRLRSLYIAGCPVLKELTGWKYLRELGWLKIIDCPSYHDYPDFHNLPSLKEFDHSVYGNPRRSDLGISQCVRLRRLEIFVAEALEDSGDLSCLKCLEVLTFNECNALLTITGLSGLHSLTRLILQGCTVLSRLPDLSHMKELAHVDVNRTGLEEIPGVEKLVSLKTLDCRYSKLKHLPDLHHLPALQKVSLHGTPLIEDDPSSFYFDKAVVLFNCEETRYVDVSDISDTEHYLPDSSDEEDCW